MHAPFCPIMLVRVCDFYDLTDSAGLFFDLCTIRANMMMERSIVVNQINEVCVSCKKTAHAIADSISKAPMPIGIRSTNKLAGQRQS